MVPVTKVIKKPVNWVLETREEEEQRRNEEEVQRREEEEVQGRNEEEGQRREEEEVQRRNNEDGQRREEEEVQRRKEERQRREEEEEEVQGREEEGLVYKERAKPVMETPSTPHRPVINTQAVQAMVEREPVRPVINSGPIQPTVEREPVRPVKPVINTEPIQPTVEREPVKPVIHTETFQPTVGKEPDKSVSPVVPRERDVHTPAMSRGILLSLHFPEQLESGVYDMYQLLLLASMWGLRLAEPALLQTHLSWPQEPNPHTMYFHDIFNLHFVQDLLRGCLKVDYDVLATAEELRRKKIDDIVVVHFIKNQYMSIEGCKRKLTNNIHLFSDVVKNYFSQEASKSVPGEHKRTNRTNVTTPNQHTCRIICVDANKNIDFEELLNSTILAPGNGTANILIIVPTWRGVREYQTTFYYFDPSFIKKQKSCPHIHALQPSGKIQEAVANYRRRLSLFSPLLAVHIRLERLMPRDGRADTEVPKCVDKLLTVLAYLKEEKGLGEGNMVASRDYSPFGSKTCFRKHCRALANKLQIDQRLEKLGVKIAKYSTNKTSFTRQAGFISVVEKELLASADYLVTLGWGSYQTSLRERFMTHNRRGKEEQEHGRIIRICEEKLHSEIELTTH